MSNGRYAMTIVSNFIRKMPANTSCHQLCVGVTAAIRKRYLPFWKRDKENILEHLLQHPEERLCASAIVFSRLRREVWLVGDCQCLIDGQFFENPKPYEQVLAEQRAKEVQRLLATGMTTEQILADDTARKAIIPTMLQEMQQQNVSYAVIDGFPIPETKVPVITLDFHPTEVILASDGDPFLCRTLEESETKLSEQKQNDPLNIGAYKATKGFLSGNDSFDDRTYIRFVV